MPPGGFLIRESKPRRRRFIEVAAYKLNSHWKSSYETRGDADGRLSGEVRQWNGFRRRPRWGRRPGGRRFRARWLDETGWPARRCEPQVDLLHEPIGIRLHQSAKLLGFEIVHCRSESGYRQQVLPCPGGIVTERVEVIFENEVFEGKPRPRPPSPSEKPPDRGSQEAGSVLASPPAFQCPRAPGS